MISADEWPQTYALESAATGTGIQNYYEQLKISRSLFKTKPKA
jgi:hypothetical protein